MNVKEKHALNLEFHKLNRLYNETKQKNDALETECAKLREFIKNITENHEAFLKQHIAKIEIQMQKLISEQERKKNEQERKKNEQERKKNEQERINQFKKELQLQASEEEFKAKKKQLDIMFDAASHKREIEHREELQKLNNERTQLNLKIEPMMLNKQIEFDTKMNFLNDEIVKHQTNEKIMNEAIETYNNKNKYVDSEIKKMHSLQENLNKEKSGLIEERLVLQKLNNERTQLNLKIETMMLNKQMEFDTKMNFLNDEIVKHQTNEKIMNEAIETYNNKSKHIDSEIKKMHSLQENLNKEKSVLIEERLVLQKEQTIFEQEKNENNDMLTIYNKLITTLMEEIEQLKNKHENECKKLIQINDSLKERLEVEKPISEIFYDIATKNLAHMQLIRDMEFNNKRVVIYSHYSDYDEVESYNWLTVECIQHYFDYVIILSNCPNKWNANSVNHNKFFLLNYNMKSDFRNYGAFIMQIGDKLADAACLALVNDSFVVVDVNAFGRCVKNIFEVKLLSHNFIGLTSSYENQFHMQSYFVLFNSPIIKDIIDYFKTTGLPNNHGEAISKYELGLSAHLKNNKVSHFSYVSNIDMQNPFNTTCCKWSEVLNKTGIIKRQHLFKKYAYGSMTDADILEVAEKHSYNKHFINFLKFHNRK